MTNFIQNMTIFSQNWNLAGDQIGIIIIILIWSLIWKGLALWHSARRSQRNWFIALLILNTLGILEIIYLFVIAKVQKKDK